MESLQEIIKKQIEQHANFSLKTEYSKEKYKKRKEAKYVDHTAEDEGLSDFRLPGTPSTSLSSSRPCSMFASTGLTKTRIASATSGQILLPKFSTSRMFGREDVEM